MSLLPKKPPLRIGRAERKLRDDRAFVVATEDSVAPEQYFRNLPFPRVRVVVLPTPKDSGHSAPIHVVERLKEAFESAQGRGEINEGDEFWVLLDTDHRTQGTHLRETTNALTMAKQSRFEIAVCNPCFELWLLLHHQEVDPLQPSTNCGAIEQRLRDTLGSYRKTDLQKTNFTLSLVPHAIARARALESDPDSPKGLWPDSIGARIYRLLERILKSS